MINTHKDHPDGDELIRKSDIYDILDNDYLVADRKEERLRGLKGIQPKRGEWKLNIEIKQDKGYFLCSVCEKDVDVQTAYCPHCGADMRGEDE